MARYVHTESGTEYSTAIVVFAVVVLVTLGWIVAGAIAAVPAALGFVSAAMWVWGILGGIWTGNILLGMKVYKDQSRRVQ